MTSVPATTFPHFLDLPFEIRWEIYNLCLPTRVIDNGIASSLILTSLPTYIPRRDHAPALRYIVTKYSRMPTIGRAIPEVYRKLMQLAIPPPAKEWAWAWTWDDDARGPEVFFQDPSPILFDPRSDVLYISPHDCNLPDYGDVQLIDRSPCQLAKSPDTVVAIDEWSLQSLDWKPSIANYCFLGRKNCTIILSETRLVKPMESIVSCGLFGLFGEERTVLVDVDDFELVDYFDKKLNGQDIHPRRGYEDPIMPGGIRRYSSHGTVDFQKAWDEESPVVSAEDRAQLIAKDKNEMLHQVKVAWLEVNGCDDLLSWVVDEDEELLAESRVVFDEEDPIVKIWLDKLPAFSFAVRVYAQDLEECARLWVADLARLGKTAS